MFCCSNYQLSRIPRISKTSAKAIEETGSTTRRCSTVREHLGLRMRAARRIGSRIPIPCWMGNTSETSGRVAKDRDLPTKVGWRWKVEEEEDEDDEGPVELTGAYKTLQLDIKRLKERLRYLSKRWEMRIISICEEDREAIEDTAAMSTIDCTAVNHEAIVVHQEPQSVIISRVRSQLVHVISNETVSSDATGQSVQSCLDTLDIKSSEVNCSFIHQAQQNIESINSVQMLSREAQEPIQQDACEVSETNEIEVNNDLQASTHIKSLEDQGCIRYEDSTTMSVIEAHARVQVLLTPIQVVKEVANEQLVKKKQRVCAPSETAAYIEDGNGMTALHWDVYLKLAEMAYKSYHCAGHRIVFDPGGTQRGRH